MRHCGWYPDTKIRLFPKGSGQWTGEYVHEELTFPNSGAPTHLAGDLLHYSYYTRQEHLDRVAKYTDLAAQKLKAKGKKGGALKGVFSAVARFFRMYFLQAGFLDGSAGWHICRISAHAAYLRYQKLALLQKGTRA